MVYTSDYLKSAARILWNGVDGKLDQASWVFTVFWQGNASLIFVDPTTAAFLLLVHISVRGHTQVMMPESSVVLCGIWYGIRHRRFSDLLSNTIRHLLLRTTAPNECLLTLLTGAKPF